MDPLDSIATRLDMLALKEDIHAMKRHVILWCGIMIAMTTIFAVCVILYAL